ncbi:MAG: KEOPS complex subunit Pcc1 [Candidatus Bathyarchaeia archaeon]|jgi:tRNA threonylcarbamoyladenosine modification (KEOPS) complex  Pcc1 subunit
MRRTKDSAEARISVLFRSRQQMEAIAEALHPEILHPAGEKAQARITKGGKMLKLQFEARDSSALRAIMTSYLRLLGAAVNVSKSLRQLEINGETKPTHATRSKN